VTPVNYGATQAYTITPATGYHVADVLVDGVSAGAVTSYNFTNVTANHTISASFAALACSWNAVNNFQTYSTYPMTVAAKGDTILVGTHKQGVFRSPDNGSNWVQDPSFVTIGMNYLTGLAVLGGRCFVGNNYGNGKLFYSSDYGTSWSSTTGSGSVVGFAYYGVTNRYFAATSGGVMNSTDNGASWTLDGGSLSSANALVVNGSILYAGTSDGVQSRSVLGYTWNGTGTGIPSGVAVNALILFGGAVYAGAGDGVYKYNGTDTWTKVSSGLPTSGVIALAVNGSSIFAGTNYNGVYMSTDGGASWSAVNTGLPSNWTATAIAVNNTTIYAVSSTDYNVYSSPLP
jgi:hypothetical protein